jgi:hypothetical protein
VSGKVAPAMVKPAPLIDAELTVTAAVPVEDNKIDWDEAEFTATLPNARLLALMARVGVLLAAVKVYWVDFHDPLISEESWA